MDIFLQKIRLLLFSKTAKHTYIIFFGNGLSAVLAFVFTVSVTRYLNLSDFGYFSAVLSFILLLTDVADLGISSSLSRFLPTMEEKPKELLNFLKSSFVVQLLISTILMFSVYLLSGTISSILFHSEQYTELIKVASFGIFSAIMGNFFQGALSARQRFSSVGFLSVFGSAIRVLLFFVLVFLSSVSLWSVNLIQVLSLFVLGSAAVSLLGVTFIRAEILIHNIKRLLKFTYHIAISRALTALASRLDVLMLISLTNANETGIYSVASRVISLFPLLAGSFSQVIAPKLAAMKSKRELKLFLFNVTFGTIGIICGIILLMIIANPFMTILFKDKGVPAIGVFRLLLVSMIFFVASVPAVSTVIYYLKKPHVLTINSILQVIIVCGGNYILIPMYGKYGAAYSSILAFSSTLFLTTGMCYYYLKKHDDS